MPVENPIQSSFHFENLGVPQILHLNRQTDNESNPITWVDLDLRENDTVDWIEQESGLSAEIKQRLLKSNELSQREVYDDGMLISIHAKKIQPIASQNDSESTRIWIERDRLITVRSEASPAADALRVAAQDNTKHWEPYQVLVFLLRASLRQFEPLISDIFSKTTMLEDQTLDADDKSVDDDELNVVRHQTIRARQHLVMLRNLLAFVSADDTLPISKKEHQALESARRHVLGYLESLEECRERAQLLQDQIDTRMADRLNRITYNLNILASVFLPLGFVTGLFGMSVAGIPDAHNPWAFAIICVVMVLMAVGSWLFLRWRRWI
jgi:zinc transporter